MLLIAGASTHDRTHNGKEPLSLSSTTGAARVCARHPCKTWPMTSIWAHRGASGHAPENTMAALCLAEAQGAAGVEIDVQRSADGHIVVIHDETVDRTTDGSGAVVDLTLNELLRLDASCGMEGFLGARIPTLREVLQWLHTNNLMLNIELKNSIERYPGMEDEVVALVEEYEVGERVVYSSFHHGSIASLVDRVPTTNLALLLGDSLVEPWNYVAGLGVKGIHPGLHLLQDPGWIEAAHGAGLEVRAWPVNTPGHVVGAAALGVDVLMTDFPDMALAALAEADD